MTGLGTVRAPGGCNDCAATVRAWGAAATVRGWGAAASDCEGHLGRCSDCEGLGRCSDWKAWGAAATVRGNLLGLQGAREAAATAKAWGRRGAWVQREGCRDCEAACRFTARD